MNIDIVGGAILLAGLALVTGWWIWVRRAAKRTSAQARRQAEPIMDGAKSAYYEDAAMWLRKAKQAYEALGQKVEWRNYLDVLRDKHQRKYKLMPLLKML